MSVKVVDASAIAALLFAEPEADAIAQRLDGARLVAPPLMGFELANVCLVKGRRHPEQKAALAEAFRFRHRLAVEEVAIDHDDSLALAAATGLTAYDASYLWLAQKMGAELVTLDRGLASASERSVS